MAIHYNIIYFHFYIRLPYEHAVYETFDGNLHKMCAEYSNNNIRIHFMLHNISLYQVKLLRSRHRP